MYRAFSEDDTELLQQLRALIVKPACYWKVRPLHSLTETEETNRSIGILYGVTPNILPYLLEEADSPN